MPPHLPLTPMTLDHIKSIEAAGHRIVDVALAKVLPDIYQITLRLDDEALKEFYHKDTTHSEIVRYQEQICAHTAGYGARALLNGIHREVLHLARTQQLPPEH